MVRAIFSAVLHHLGVGHDLADQAHHAGLLRRHRPAGEQHAHGVELAHRPHQALGAADAGHDADADLGLAKRAPSPATMMSQCIASSAPPP
jgi:hypothetical protein